MRDIVPIGIALILIGFAIVILGSLLQPGQGGKSETKVAFGGFIGPIPFGLAKDRPMLYLVMALLAFAVVAWLVLRAMR
jgi:uncharacterized membrane protein